MLTVHDLAKSYRAGSHILHAVSGLSLHVAEGEMVTLLGPSGCGKTTVLRCVAGLERPDAGEIEIDGVLVSSRLRRAEVPTPTRPLSMVFQSYAIWPHMTVFENVAYPLRVGKEKVSSGELRQRVAHALELLRIPELADRSATSLSGGQQQRVAVARALIRQPKLLLMDEPLSNLDAKLREEMRRELKELFARTGVSVLYVTHDLVEALVLSDRIVVMDAGSIVQEGSPQELYAAPSNQFVASFLGTSTVLEGRVQGPAAGGLMVDMGLGRMVCAPGSRAFAEGEPVLVALRPESLSLADNHMQEEGLTVPCVVESATFLGAAMEYRVNAGGYGLLVRMSSNGEVFAAGQATTLHIPPDGCVVLPPALA